MIQIMCVNISLRAVEYHLKLNITIEVLIILCVHEFLIDRMRDDSH